MERLISSSLPQIIQSFEKNGFAASIFPPYIRDPPNFQIESLHDEEEDDKQEGDSHEHSVDSYNEDGDDNMEEEDVSVQNPIVESSEDFIDIHEFSQSNKLNFLTSKENVSLKKNLLASLIKMTDVSSSMDKDKYILNVNFAGSETHESAIRVLLQDSTGLLDTWCSYEKGKIHEKEMESFFMDPPSALIYYGYLVYTKSS
jgi:hypothetical protein